MGKASVKVEGGKMVNVEVETGEKLTDISVTGDFFLEPPEALEEVQEELEGLSQDFEESEVVERLEEMNAEFIGFSPEDVVEALKEAVNNE